MIDPEAAARAAIIARLAASREELRQILEPPPKNGGNSADGAHPGEFPRSRTMRMLMSAKGLGTVGAAAAGLLVARPALALRLLRMLPAGALARMLLARAVTALRSKQ
jgi:hypothetical protein